MPIFEFFIELLRDPRSFIAEWINQLGPIWAYLPLALIIFAETGFVFTPFLPGDSLLFAAGVFAAPGGGLNIIALIVICAGAAVLGNTSNYWIGRKLGATIIASGRVKSLTPERLAKTQGLFDKYGLLAVVLTRFFPFIRTFAPFLAGFGGMHFGRFSLFNVIGGTLWVSLFTLLGYFFGGLPFIQDHFEMVIIAIIVISVIPSLVGVLRARFGRSPQTSDDSVLLDSGAEPTKDGSLDIVSDERVLATTASVIEHIAATDATLDVDATLTVNATLTIHAQQTADPSATTSSATAISSNDGVFSAENDPSFEE